jgi:hypothetical protein
MPQSGLWRKMARVSDGSEAAAEIRDGFVRHTLHARTFRKFRAQPAHPRAPTGPTPEKAFGYVWVSTEKQASSGMSREAQQRQVTGYAMMKF